MLIKNSAVVYIEPAKSRVPRALVPHLPRVSRALCPMCSRALRALLSHVPRALRDPRASCLMCFVPYVSTFNLRTLNVS